MALFVRRSLAAPFLEAAKHFKIVLVTWARQVGKTTFLRHLAGSDRHYVTLDDAAARHLASTDPALFIQRYPPPVLIDEIQYAPELLPCLKIAVDGSEENGRFWLTGSQHFHLMKGLSESLAGRVGILELTGLSSRELDGIGDASVPFVPTVERIEMLRGEGRSMEAPELFRRIWRGGYPQLARDPGLDPASYYGSYVHTYVQRDVRDLAQVGDELSFIRFLRATAARTGQLLNYSELARDADVAPNTAKRWLSILRTNGLVYLLEPYHANITKRLVKSPKLHFVDTGLAAWLSGWTSPEALQDGAAAGAFLETWVVGQILRSWWNAGKQAPVWYYPGRGTAEVDLVAIQDGTVYPIEIRKTASPSPALARPFGHVGEYGLRVGQGTVVCLVMEAHPLSRTVWAVPAGAI